MLEQQTESSTIPDNFEKSSVLSYLFQTLDQNSLITRQADYEDRFCIENTDHSSSLEDVLGDLL